MLNLIEKIAKLMGLSYTISGDRVWLQYDTSKREYNPLTNKVDLMDVECLLGIDIKWFPISVMAITWYEKLLCSKLINFKVYNDDKLLARAHAVCFVAEQIYDRRYNNAAKQHE